ncbi:hypothetical protein [Streptomyces sp. T028]|uniref:hypothetical protein n=1 Tax=Streptomyces sp. T028 TaxID=3394379 RepID=UPI003A858A4D
MIKRRGQDGGLYRCDAVVDNATVAIAFSAIGLPQHPAFPPAVRSTPDRPHRLTARRAGPRVTTQE